MAMGYPHFANLEVDNEFNNALANECYYTGLYKDDPELAKKLKFSPEVHIMMNTLETVEAAQLIGMSGGAVINLGNIVDLELRADDSTPEPSLSALSISYSKVHQTIIAIRIDKILQYAFS